MKNKFPNMIYDVKNKNKRRLKIINCGIAYYFNFYNKQV